jgi:hypothetical protein
MNRPHTKVALFVPSIRAGGANRVMVNLANGFAARGLDADLVVASAKVDFRKHVAPVSASLIFKVAGFCAAFRGSPATCDHNRQVLLTAMDCVNVLSTILAAVIGHQRIITRLHEHRPNARGQAAPTRGTAWTGRHAHHRFDIGIGPQAVRIVTLV